MTNPAKDDEALVGAVSEELQLAGCPAPDPDAAYAEKQRDFEDFARVAITAVRAYDEQRGMVTVPREPTQAMLDVGWASNSFCEMPELEDLWRDMIEAAAKPDGDAARDMTAAEQLQMERETTTVHRAFDAVFGPRHSQWKGDK